MFFLSCGGIDISFVSMPSLPGKWSSICTTCGCNNWSHLKISKHGELNQQPD